VNVQSLRTLGEKLAGGAAFEEVCARLRAVQAERAAGDLPVPLPPSKSRPVA